MQKNTAGKWVVFAFNVTDNTATTGDAANITANMRIDGGAANAIDDLNPTELSDGYYIFDITAVEANGDNLLLTAVSATGSISVIGVPGAVWTRPPNFETLGITAGAVDTVTTTTTATNLTTNNDKTGYALSSTGADLILKSSTFALAIADAIWDELLAGHVTADSSGLVLNEWQDGGRLDAILDARMAEASITTSAGAVTTVTTATNLTNLPSIPAAWITAAGIATDAITAAKIAAAAITDSEFTATGTGLSAIPWNAAWDTEVESEVNDALDTAIAELGVAAPTATPTVRTGVMLMYMALRNKLVVQTSGTDAIEVYNDAGTKIASKLITDDGADYTEAEML